MSHHFDYDVAVLGAGPAGVIAALRAAQLGSRVALIARDGFGWMAANDGPVRALAHTARLIRAAKQLGRYGVVVDGFSVDYAQVLARVREVVGDVREVSFLVEDLTSLGVVVHEHAGNARFVDSHCVAAERGLEVSADKFVVCTGGVSKKLPIPGFEHTSTHSDAWALSSVPESIIVVGCGATGMQVASIFNAFGSRIQLFEAGPRVLPAEDEDVASAVAQGFREAGMVVREGFGAIESFEKTGSGVRMTFSKDGARESAEVSLVVVALAVGWVADTAGLDLSAAGITANARGFV